MRFQFESNEQVYEVQIEQQGETFRAVINRQAFDFDLLDDQPGQISVRHQGRPATIYWAGDGTQTWFSFNGCAFRLEKPRPLAARGGPDGTGGSAHAGIIRSPMPAQIRAVQVEEGEQVEKGQTLLLLEAMKMEIRARAPAAGRVKRLLVAEGQAVEKDQALVEMGAEES